MLDNVKKITKQEEALKMGRVSLNDVKDAFRGLLNKKLHIQGSIPEHKLINAKKGMGISEPVSSILCIYDDCAFFSPGDTGFAIVPTGIYMRKVAEKPVFFSWNEIDSVRLSWYFKSLIINGCCGPGQMLDEKFVSAIRSLVWAGARKSL